MVSSLQRGQWHDLAEARPGLNGNFYRSFDDDDGDYKNNIAKIAKLP